MKKLLILLLTCGCGYAPMTSENPLVIDEIKVTTWHNQCNCLCNYYGKSKFGNARVLTPCGYKFKYTDTCGKYHIGDIITIIKK